MESERELIPSGEIEILPPAKGEDDFNASPEESGPTGENQETGLVHVGGEVLEGEYLDPENGDGSAPEGEGEQRQLELDALRENILGAGDEGSGGAVSPEVARPPAETASPTPSTPDSSHGAESGEPKKGVGHYIKHGLILLGGLLLIGFGHAFRKVRDAARGKGGGGGHGAPKPKASSHSGSSSHAPKGGGGGGHH